MRLSSFRLAMVVPLLLSVVRVENDCKETEAIMIEESERCPSKISSFDRPEMMDDNGGRGGKHGSEIRKGRTTHVKTILANPKLTEAQILARKFANDALQSAKVQKTLKQLTNVRTQPEFSYVPPLPVKGKGRSSVKTKRRKKNRGQLRRKSGKRRKGNSRKKISSKNLKQKRNLPEAGWLEGKEDREEKSVKNMYEINDESTGNLVGRRKERKAEEMFNGERMIDRLMKTTTRDPTKEKPGDQGVEYSEYYSDNEDPEDSSIYRIQSRIDDTAIDSRVRRNSRDQRMKWNFYNQPDSYDKDFAYSDEKFHNSPDLATDFDQYSHISDANADYYSNYLSNDASNPDKRIENPVDSNFYSHEGRRNPIDFDEDSFSSGERVKNVEPLSTFEVNENKRRQNTVSREISNPIRQPFGKVLESLGINVDEDSESNAVDEIGEKKQAAAGRKHVERLNESPFSSGRVAGRFAERVSDFDEFPRKNKGRLMGKSSFEEERGVTEVKTVSGKLDDTTCSAEEAKLAKKWQKAKGRKSRVDEEPANITATANHTKEVANEILNRIIDELAEFKMDRTRKNRKEGEACKLTGSWISSQAGIKIGMKVANGSINATFEKCNDQAVHQILFNSTWNVTGNVPFTIGAPFSLFAVNNTTKSLAVFVGACKICQGFDTIQGVWSVAREPKDCRDVQVSTTVFNDVFRKMVMPSTTTDNTTMPTSTNTTTGKRK